MLIPTILASWPLRYSVHISSVHMSSKYSYRVVPVPRKIPVYSKENTIKKIHVADDSVRHTLGEANHDHTCSKMVSPRSRGKYTLKEREKMGMYATENSQPGLLDASLSLCRQLCSTMFKLTCGWAPPLPGCHSRDQFSKTLPVFRLSSASLCYHQHKLENEKWDRPGNEANCRLFLTTEEVTCCHTFTECHFPCAL